MHMGSRAMRVSTRLAVQLVAVSVLVIGAVTPAVAARPGHGGSGGSTGSDGSTTTGADVSYPQCGTTLPSFAFGIVGVNDGLANNFNPCLGPSSSYPSYTQSELYWAVTASTGLTSPSTQPKASLYVNTADPGNMYNGKPIADWPTSGTNTDGTCTTTTVTSRGHTYTVGANSDACAWEYGYNKATQDATWLTDAADAIDNQMASAVPTSPSSYPWWLDVETGNTWQSDTSMNVADLQGMVAGLQNDGATSIGAYSTASQWNSITGGTTSTLRAGSLYGIPNWIPGATTQSQAESNCTLSSFTGGSVVVTQWTGSPDNDWACLPA